MRRKAFERSMRVDLSLNALKRGMRLPTDSP